MNLIFFVSDYDVRLTVDLLNSIPAFTCKIKALLTMLFDFVNMPLYSMGHFP
jgi:hypothetical protein